MSQAWRVRPNVRRCWPLALLTSAGCITIASSVATPTALEHQLLGVYRELDDDLVYASSVRGDFVSPSGSYEALKSLALEGRSLQRFNEDDLAELKAAGCLAETLDAKIVDRPCDGVVADTGLQPTLQRVIRDENRARSAILTWAAHAYAREAGAQRPGPEALAEIRRTYRRLLFEAATAGHLFEVEPGVFSPVSR